MIALLASGTGYSLLLTGSGGVKTLNFKFLQILTELLDLILSISLSKFKFDFISARRFDITSLFRSLKLLPLDLTSLFLSLKLLPRLGIIC